MLPPHAPPTPHARPTPRSVSATLVRRPTPAGRRAALSLAFVMAALVALVGLPLVSDRYAAPLHEEVRAVAEPGRGLVTRIHLALALEHAALRDYVETGDTALRARYEAEARAEGEAYARLAPLAERLGPAVRASYAELRAREAAWHASVAGVLADGPAIRRQAALVEAERYEQTLVAAAHLDAAIDHAAQSRRRRILAADRAERWLAAALGAIAVAAGVVVARLGHRVHAFAAEAERRRAELERATESRARLMRGVSHDLKNPLGAIDGYAQLLEDGVMGPLVPAQRESVTRIRRSVRSLLGLVGDLLELAQAEEGQLSVRPRPTDVGAVIRDAAEEHRAAAAAAGHSLHVEIADGLPAIATDAARVRQVLGNLLSNAVKYTPAAGALLVRAELRPRPGAPPTRAWVAADVVDSGPGIPAGREEEIFGEFARLEPDAKPGAGLGLAIARRIARLLGGDITVGDAATGGAAFTLWLPAGALPPAPTAAPVHSDASMPDGAAPLARVAEA